MNLSILDKDTRNTILQDVMENRCPICLDTNHIKYFFEFIEEGKPEFNATCCDKKVEIPQKIIIEKLKDEFKKIIDKELYEEIMKFIETREMVQFLTCYNLVFKKSIEDSGAKLNYVFLRFIQSMVGEELQLVIWRIFKYLGRYFIPKNKNNIVSGTFYKVKVFETQF